MRDRIRAPFAPADPKRRYSIIDKLHTPLIRDSVEFVESSESDNSSNELLPLPIRRRSSDIDNRTARTLRRSSSEFTKLAEPQWKSLPRSRVSKPALPSPAPQLPLHSGVVPPLALSALRARQHLAQRSCSDKDLSTGRSSWKDELESIKRSSSLSPEPTSKKREFIGKYIVEVGQTIGKGGFSSVYEVQDCHVATAKYALKIVHITNNVQDEIRESLLKEVKIMQSLVNAEHVVQLLAFNVTPDKDKILILMELGHGDLRHILNCCNDSTKPLDIEFVRYWGGQILRAVAAIHKRNIVHSDLKPANFVIVNGCLKLCDFGIANPVPDNTCSIRRNNAVGTLLYMAPETLRTSDEYQYKVTKASDMWSCGIILYEMVYQAYPFNQRTYLHMVEACELPEVEHPRTTPADSPVPLALHEVIRDCLFLDPALRVSAANAGASVFFSPVSVDLDAVRSIVTNAVKYGSQLEKLKGELRPDKIEELALMLYQRLERFNNGCDS